MGDLEKKVSTLKNRLRLFRGLDYSWWGLFGGLSAAAIIVLTDKMIPLSIPIGETALGCIVGGSIIGLSYGFFKRFTMFEAALKADASLQLRERLSSAILLREYTAGNPALSAVVDDAERHAQALQVSKDFRYRMPRHARYTFFPALALFAAFFIPQMDIFAKADQTVTPPPVVESRTIPEEVRREEANRLRELAKETRESKLNDELLELQLADRLERLSQDLSMGKINEKEAIAEMSRLNDELRIAEKDLSKEFQPFKEIRGLNQAKETRELQKALKDQDFAAAQQELQSLMEQVMSELEQMSAEDLQSLAQEMEQLAQELQQNPQMAEAMKQIAEALKECAECKNPGGSEGDQSQQASASQQSGSQQSEQSQQDGQSGQQQGTGASQQAPTPSMGMTPQQMQQMQSAISEAMNGAQNSLSDMQEMQQQMQQLQQLQQSLSDCQGACMGGGDGGTSGSGGQRIVRQPGPAGEFGTGDSQNRGGGAGSGNPGQGGGGQVPDSGAMAQAFIDEFIPGEKHEGEIVAIFEVDASVPAGESTLNYSGVPAELRQRAADSVRSQEIPAGMRGTVRDYFESINFGNQGANNE